MIDYTIIGKRFGKLVVLHLDHLGVHHSTYWLCQCDCGNQTVVSRGSLTSGDTISCGCYHKEHSHEFGFKHGLTYHPLYGVWAGMNNRCRNPNAGNYQRYGGRGIDVCDEWKTDFKSFYDWSMANGYRKGLTLDRKDNSGNYYPDNCRWVDRTTQQNNRRNNHYITFGDETHTLTEWSRMMNINYETLRCRVLKNDYHDFEQYFKDSKLC